MSWETLRKRQQQAHEQIEQLQIQLGQADRLQPQDIDLLKRVELEQKQITSKLQHPLDGVSTRTAELLAELKNNNVPAPEMQGRLQQIAEELRVIQQRSSAAGGTRRDLRPQVGGSRSKHRRENAR